MYSGCFKLHSNKLLGFLQNVHSWNRLEPSSFHLRTIPIQKLRNQWVPYSHRWSIVFSSAARIAEVGVPLTLSLSRECKFDKHAFSFSILLQVWNIVAASRVCLWFSKETPRRKLEGNIKEWKQEEFWLVTLMNYYDVYWQRKRGQRRSVYVNKLWDSFSWKKQEQIMPFPSMKHKLRYLVCPAVKNLHYSSFDCFSQMPFLGFSK